MLLILKHYIKDLLRACNHYHSSNCISTVNVNAITHLPASYKLTCIDNVQQACMASSVTHALHVTTLKHCHIVAMGTTLLLLPNSLSST